MHKLVKLFATLPTLVLAAFGYQKHAEAAPTGDSLSQFPANSAQANGLRQQIRQAVTDRFAQDGTAEDSEGISERDAEMLEEFLLADHFSTLIDPKTHKPFPADTGHPKGERNSPTTYPVPPRVGYDSIGTTVQIDKFGRAARDDGDVFFRAKHIGIDFNGSFGENGILDDSEFDRFEVDRSKKKKAAKKKSAKKKYAKKKIAKKKFSKKKFGGSNNDSGRKGQSKK